MCLYWLRSPLEQAFLPCELLPELYQSVSRNLSWNKFYQTLPFLKRQTPRWASARSFASTTLQKAIPTYGSRGNWREPTQWHIGRGDGREWGLRTRTGTLISRLILSARRGFFPIQSSLFRYLISSLAQPKRS